MPKSYLFMYIYRYVHLSVCQSLYLCGRFDRLDTDKSGVIEADELKNALRAVGQHPM